AGHPGEPTALRRQIGTATGAEEIRPRDEAEAADRHEGTAGEEPLVQVITALAGRGAVARRAQRQADTATTGRRHGRATAQRQDEPAGGHHARGIPRRVLEAIETNGVRRRRARRRADRAGARERRRGTEVETTVDRREVRVRRDVRREEVG